MPFILTLFNNCEKGQTCSKILDLAKILIGAVRHSLQHNDIQHNDTQHNDSQHNNKKMRHSAQ